MRPQRVLVVDDQAPIRDTLVRVLTRIGYDVLTADSGETAYALLEREPVDAVLLDVQMPSLPGTAVYHAIVSRWPELRDAIAIMTGDPERADLADWLELQGCPVLHKPFDVGQVRSLLDRMLVERRRDANGA